MKRIKRFASVVLAAAMVMTTALPAFAADNHSHDINIKQNTSDAAKHTYQAYQIFAGDLKNEGTEAKPNYRLSNIVWGSGVTNGDSIITELKAESSFVSQNREEYPNTPNLFAQCKTAADVASVLAGDYFKSSTKDTKTLTDTVATIISKYLTKDTEKYEEVTGTGNITIRVPSSGYYLVKDKERSLSGNNDAYTRFLLEVVGDADVTVKSDVPHGDKQIYQAVQKDDGSYEIVSADANYGTIGSHVAYVISSQVPNYTGYNHYYFIMNDKLDEGLTFDGKNTVSVNVVSPNGIDKWNLKQNSDYYVYTQEDNDTNNKPVGDNTFRLGFADIMQYPIGSKIEVTYTATVNGKAVIGVSGNANTWNLQYSNNPNTTYGGDPDEEPNPHPGLPLDREENGNVLGQTPDEKTLTYLTELDITKYANEVSKENLLEGAEFTLTGTSHQVVLNNVTYYEQSKDGEWYLLKDGTYTKKIPKEGDEVRYEEIGVGTKETTTGYISVNGKYFVPDSKSEYEGKTLYQLVKVSSNNNYVDVNTKYVSRNDTKKGVVSVNVSMQEITFKDGKISFKGLGEGTYTLTETVTPDGFNTLNPITFTIKCITPDEVKTGDERCTWTIEMDDSNKDKDIKFEQGKITIGDENIDNGIFAGNIINNSGSLLPSTGGIGTTIFYIIGGILVLGAAILLITKKRMSREA